jgi:hypothetical protein
LIPQIPLFCLVLSFGNICNLENQQLICEDRQKYGHSLLPAEAASFQYNRHNFAGASREVEVQITTIVDEVLLIDVKDFSASLN